jgi:hypothetical protein
MMAFCKFLKNCWSSAKACFGVRKGKVIDEDSTRLFNRIQKKLKKRLKGFSPGEFKEVDGKCTFDIRPKPDEFPVPSLVCYLLNKFLDFPILYRREEKIRWSIVGKLDETNFLIELRKMGFVFVFPTVTSEPISRRVVKQISGAISALDKEFKKIIDFQILNGNVTIPNLFHEFRNRYQFFREKALGAFHNFQPDPEADELTTGMQKSFHQTGFSSEGFYFSVEMIDSYFSLLEHVLLLHFAFIGHCKEKGQLLEFLFMNWEDKFKKIIQIDQIEGFDKVWGDLKSIKERYRNPFAHGGNENDGSSLFIHLPGFEPVPASLNEFKHSPRFDRMHPIERGDFERISELFNKVDSALSSTNLEPSYKMLVGSIDPAFDKESQKKYQEAVNSDVDRFVAEWNDRMDRLANFD